jgi:uncharacterized phage infection (PIP) family protein YhgE
LKFVGETWNKFINSRTVDKTLQFLTLASALHNASMLSTNLGSSLMFLVDEITGAIGLKDDEGNPFSLSSVLKTEFDYFLKGIFGVETLENIKVKYRFFNTIYNAALNTFYSIAGVVDSVRTIVEISSEYIGKIGNGLRRSGVVNEKSYNPMMEKFDNIGQEYPDRFGKFSERIDQIENVISALSTVTSELVSIKDAKTELDAQKLQYKQELRQYQTTQTNITQSEDHDVPQSLKDLEEESKINSEAPVNLDTARF